MAKFGVEGLDDVVKDLKRLGELTGEVADEMLEAGAEPLVNAWKNSIRSHGLVDTGELIDSVAPTKVKTSKDGVHYIEVTATGKDKKGVRNAEKAFINNYGTSKIKATRFVDDAEDKAADSVHEAMENVYTQKLQKEGLI